MKIAFYQISPGLRKRKNGRQKQSRAKKGRRNRFLGVPALSTFKRTNFLRMLVDVKQDKVDLILFTRFDRRFRSAADYYKVMEILDAHNCGWLTTQEQYVTTTAGGRLYINLRLSIAQNEAGLCGE